MKNLSPLVTFALLFFSLTGTGAGQHTAFLSISPMEAKVKVDQEVTLQIEAQEAEDLFGAPFYLNYDPHFLKAVRLTEGDFLKKDGQKTAFLYRISEEKKRIVIGLTRLGKIAGVSGHGVLALVTFKAQRAGRAVLSFEKVDFKNSRQESIQVRYQTDSIEIIR